MPRQRGLGQLFGEHHRRDPEQLALQLALHDQLFGRHQGQVRRRSEAADAASESDQEQRNHLKGQVNDDGELSHAVDVV